MTKPCWRTTCAGKSPKSSDAMEAATFARFRRRTSKRRTTPGLKGIPHEATAAATPPDELVHRARAGPVNHARGAAPGRACRGHVPLRLRKLCAEELPSAEPGFSVPPELAYRGDNLPSRTDQEWEGQAAHHQCSAAKPEIADGFSFLSGVRFGQRSEQANHRRQLRRGLGGEARQRLSRHRRFRLVSAALSLEPVAKLFGTPLITPLKS